MEGVGRKNLQKETNISVGGIEGIDKGRGREADTKNDQGASPNDRRAPVTQKVRVPVAEVALTVITKIAVSPHVKLRT